MALTVLYLREDLPGAIEPLVNLLRTGTPAVQLQVKSDNLLVRVHFIIVMIRWIGLAPREFEFPVPGSLTSTFLDRCGYGRSDQGRRPRQVPQLRTGCEPGSVFGVWCIGVESPSLRVWHTRARYTTGYEPRPERANNRQQVTNPDQGRRPRQVPQLRTGYEPLSLRLTGCEPLSQSLDRL